MVATWPVPCGPRPNTVRRNGVSVASRAGLIAAIDTAGVRSVVKAAPSISIRGDSVVASSEIADDVHVGPFAHLRGGTVLGSHVHIGNFVETKKARLADGVKAGHLTYLGDATVGARTNIGAGTITCNYDGVRKHETRIGEDAFIGTNSSLVAPITIGDRAITGAGTVAIRDVPPDDKVVGNPARSIARNAASKKNMRVGTEP